MKLNELGTLRSDSLYKLSEYCLYGAFFFLPIGKAPMEICLAAGIFSWLIFKLVNRQSVNCNQKLLWLIIIFLASSCISAMSSGYPAASTRGVIKLAKYIFVMLMAADLLQDSKRLKILLCVGAVSLLAVILDSYYQLFTGTDLLNQRTVDLMGSLNTRRITGPFITYGLLAAYFIGVLPFLVIYTINKNDMRVMKRVVVAMMMFAIMFLLYKTHSRGAWLATIGAGFFASWMMRSKVLGIIILLIIFLGALFLPTRDLLHLDVGHKEQSLVERYHLWQRALNVIQARPLFGCGINTYAVNHEKYDRQKHWRVPGYYAHNGYLQLAAETGLVSLILFATILLRIYQSAFQAYKSHAPAQKLMIVSVSTALIALLLQAGVDTTLHNLQSAVYIWFFMGMMLAVASEKSIVVTHTKEATA